MSEFLDYADLRHVDWRDGRPVWMTLAPLRYRSDYLGATIVVPAEFITDLASVPRVALAWWVAGGRGLRSAVIHDFPYEFGYWLLDDGSRLDVTKAPVDGVFHESLVADPISGAGPTLARLMYYGVRVGGKGVWADETRTRILNPEWSAAGWRAHAEAP